VLFRGRVAIQDDPTLAEAGRMGRNDYWRLDDVSYHRARRNELAEATVWPPLTSGCG